MEKGRRILVLDGSKVVRATLGKHLKEDFDVIEEANGESAWQLLMLDSRIQVVVSGVHPLKLEAHDLLARLKASSIKRLREIPFLLIVSDLDNRVERDADRMAGVAGFLTKTMSKAELVSTLNEHLGARKAGVTHAKADKADAADKPDKEKPEKAAKPEKPAPPAHTAKEVIKEAVSVKPVPLVTARAETPAFAHERTVSTVILPPNAVAQVLPDEHDGVPLPANQVVRLLAAEQLIAALSTLTLSGPNAEMACVLVFGIDELPALEEQFGGEVAAVIASRLASLLTSKVGAYDVIGHCTDDRLAIISQGVDLKQGIRFGRQVCKSLASGQISIRGNKIKLTASVGVASTSDDYLVENSELLWLANRRLDQAFVCGGNTVVSELKPGCVMHGCDRRLIALFELLKNGPAPRYRDKLGAIGLLMIPLLREIDRELALGLSVDDVERKLLERARAEVSAWS